jgi:hypothetical protein
MLSLEVAFEIGLDIGPRDGPVLPRLAEDVEFAAPEEAGRFENIVLDFGRLAIETVEGETVEHVDRDKSADEQDQLNQISRIQWQHWNQYLR